TQLQGVGANQPLFKVNLQNGKPGVRFDGTNDFVAAADGVTLTALRFFIVLIPRALPSNHNPTMGTDGGGGWNHGLRIEATDVLNTQTWDGGDKNARSKTRAGVGPCQIVSGRSRNRVSAHMRVNGTLEGTGAAAGTIVSCGGYWNIGANAT